MRPVWRTADYVVKINIKTAVGNSKMELRRVSPSKQC